MDINWPNVSEMSESTANISEMKFLQVHICKRSNINEAINKCLLLPVWCTLDGQLAWYTHTVRKWKTHFQFKKKKIIDGMFVINITNQIVFAKFWIVEMRIHVRLKSTYTGLSIENIYETVNFTFIDVGF